MTASEKTVRVLCTIGDPTGIGPELVRATLDDAGFTLLTEVAGRGGCGLEVTVVGDRGVLARAPAGAPLSSSVRLVEVTALDAAEAQPGRPGPATGRAQVAYLEEALLRANRGEVDALVTAPIHKASCLAAGFAFPGHTELLAARLAPAGAAPLPVTMLFAGPRLRVSLATIHVALSEVPRLLDVPGLTGTIVRTARALVDDFGLPRPRLGVAGLNPHAGESGHFGDEETRLVAPAIAVARQAVPEATIEGPLVPDAVFRAHLDGRYDGVVALYHDQGLIPVKLVDFEDAVNVTLGLPIVRTSPDHGVAHDLAAVAPAPPRARPASFRAALRLAVELACRRLSR